MAVVLADKSHDEAEQKAQRDLMEWGLGASDLQEIEIHPHLSYRLVRDRLDGMAMHRRLSPKALVHGLNTPPRRRARSSIRGIDEVLRDLRRRDHP